MAAAAEGYYFARYAALWSQPEIARVHAALPSVTMWDDHDIFDGWGSWPEERQACPVFQGLGRAARRYFALFQLAARPDRLPEGFGDPAGGHFGCAFRAGPLGIVVPDLRSERSRRRIMGEAGWRDFAAALAGMAGCRHVLAMSSVPLTDVELPWPERVLVALPGHSDLEDDLRDQWQSLAHRGEWRRMLAGLVEGRGVRVFELTSSGIVHPPPPGPVAAAYEWLSRRATVLGPDLRVRRLVIPGHGKHYLRARNWLSLELAADGRHEAAWHAERGEAGRFAAGPEG